MKCKLDTCQKQLRLAITKLTRAGLVIWHNGHFYRWPDTLLSAPAEHKY